MTPEIHTELLATAIISYIDRRNLTNRVVMEFSGGHRISINIDTVFRLFNVTKHNNFSADEKRTARTLFSLYEVIDQMTQEEDVSLDSLVIDGHTFV